MATPRTAPQAPAPAPRGNGNGFMPAATPMPTSVWPIPGDVPDLNAIVDDQAETIAAQEALIHAYQGVLNAAQQLPSGAAATGSGTTSTASTSLIVTGVVGAIANGATVTDGALVPAGTTVLGLITGTTGGNGTYLVSNPLTLATATPLTFTPPPPPQFSAWPVPQDAPTLTLIQQQQTAVLRMQSSLIQSYQDLLNISQTPAPPTGP